MDNEAGGRRKPEIQVLRDQETEYSHTASCLMVIVDNADP